MGPAPDRLDRRVRQLGDRQRLRGVRGPETVAPSGPDSERVVGGHVAVDGAFTADAMGWPTGRSILRLVLMHELAHVVGLAHVTDPGQIMYDGSGTDYHSLGAGDREGLAAVGAGQCFTDT